MMKKYLLVLFLAAVIYSCGSNSQENSSSASNAPSPTADQTKSAQPAADNDKGVGKFTHVELGAALDAKMAGNGKAIYELKCSACHKLTGEKLVGPGWLGVTERRKPEWILNFVTNTDEMLNKDAKAQSMLEICMVRMPNQNLSDQDARNILEFMRQNDGVK
jgi:mono/diheme cytochrome c family protein